MPKRMPGRLKRLIPRLEARRGAVSDSQPELAAGGTLRYGPRMFVVDPKAHEALVMAAFQRRGYTVAESADAARLSELATRHGIRTHNAIKALHLDDHFGSKVGGCAPGAEIERLPSRFAASEIWDAHRKFGPSTAFAAMERCVALADQYGVGQVSVDNAFHYLWGGGYVMEIAKRGYVAYTNCTAARAEVAPFRGKFPTLGTNPHSWGFPTTEAIGFPIVIDWATSVIAMGRVQQLKREGAALPPNAAMDAEGQPTTDPHQVKALLPFGEHKGYGLSLLIELFSAAIGSSLPTLRCERTLPEGEKGTPSYYFQVIHPEALSSGRFAKGRTLAENLRAVIGDILGHGNEGCLLPGQPEHDAAQRSAKAGGLLFSEAEIREFNDLARECGQPEWDVAKLPTAN